MFALAEVVDKEVSRINGNAPDGEHRRLCAPSNWKPAT